MSELCLAARGAIVRGVNPPLSDLLRPGEFLVAFDYGMGGLWGVLIAPSVDAIADRYPELSVADAMPPWMTTADLERHREAPLWLDDEPPQGLLKALVADRERD
jgi:hypothetical protein